MPSERVTQVLEQLAPQRDLFRSAVTQAGEQLRSLLVSYRDSTDTDSERAAIELGRFARGRIDPQLFALVFGEQDALTPSAVEWIDRAEGVLQEVARTTHLLQHVVVERGGSLRFGIERALARIGRVFGAARVAEAARTGAAEIEAQYLEVFHYSAWKHAERNIALPLVVEVDGDDLNTGGVEMFLDGRQIIVLLVNGDAAPAPLARLITPNVLVAQTTAVDDVALAAAAAGPAIIAIVPDTCAQFVAQRSGLTIQKEAAPVPIKPRRRASVFQQREELLQLRALATREAATLSAPAPTPAPAPEDVLAGWLLRQADL